MKLIEINKLADSLSWDTSDTVYDAIVHVELDKDSYKSDSWMDKFTLLVYEKVNVTKFFNGAYANIICDWCEIFKKNLELWKKYTKKNWKQEYHNLWKEDEDEYIYQLIDSLHYALSGDESEHGYKEWYDILVKCK